MDAGGDRKNVRLLGPKEAASELGISRQRVLQLAKRWPEIEVEGAIDVEALKRLRAAQADPAKQHAYQISRGAAPPAAKPAKPAADEPGEQGVLDFNAARTNKEIANARLAELKAAEAEGRLIARDEVLSREYAIARKLRDRINGFPTRLQQFMTPEAMHMLVDECNKLVDELQADAARIAEES